MSWMRQGTEGGGQTNGYGNGNGYGRRYDADASSRDTSAERSRSRGPGYGGFAVESAPRRVPGPASGGLERRQANRKSGGDRGWSRSRSRPGARNGEGSKQVEEILRYIDQQWSFMSLESCVPVKVALQLMDQSSLGLADQQDQFQQVSEQLQNTLKQIVNEHHQGFNSSIGTFHQIQASIMASQQRVRGLRQSLIEAKSNLSTVRPELKAFATSSQTYDQMLQMLSHIEELQTMPEKIEALISEKQFLSAVETLQDALKLMRKPELEEVGALSDLQVFLGNQEHSVTDILIEELHSHLYLKSPYCEDRWKRNMGRTSESDMISTTGERTQLYSFLETLDLSQPIAEDTSHNPEADSFSYIHLLLESLDKMGRLDVAVDAIEHRLPVELFRVVEKCYNEVEQRHPSILRKAGPGQKMGSIWLDGDGQKAVVDDMLNTLYARFEAIAEGHRVVHDVILGITRRSNTRDSSLLRSFNELWKLYQSEIRSLLHDHLSSSGNLEGRSRREDTATGNIFKHHTRDKTRKMFKLVDTDKNSTSLVTEREDLDYILKSSVPGLVSANSSTAQQIEENAKIADRSATGHKLLVEPSVFNMGMLLPPSLSFLTRLKDVVPANSDVAVSTLTSFLDDFLVNVFLPQMEETLADQCATASGQSDAFADDPKWQMRATRPIFKGAVQLAELISSFCKMLDSLPPDQSFNQLIMYQLRAFYNRCHDAYNSYVIKVQIDPNSLKIPRRAAVAAASGDLQLLLKHMIDAKGPELEDLSIKQTTLLLSSAKSAPIDESDLITDRKSICQLSTLYTTIRWFTAQVLSLRHVDPKATKTNTSLATYTQRRWSLSPSLAESSPYLPLSPETATEFDTLINSFVDLSSLILRTIHIELRLQLLDGIARALGTTYLLNQPYNEPDPSILSLNRSLLSLDEDLSARLPAPQYAATTAGLSGLADDALVSYASSVPAMDEHGNRRMQLNILVLQQNLKEMDAQASLGQATAFWELWELGPEAVVKAVGDGLPKAEGREMVRLCYSVPPEKGGPGAEQKRLDEVLAVIDGVKL